MNWQDALVAVLVGAAAIYAAWQLLPGTVQQRVGRGLGRLAQRAGWARAGQRIEQALQPTGGCHDCEAKSRCSASTARRDEAQPVRFTRRG